STPLDNPISLLPSSVFRDPPCSLTRPSATSWLVCVFGWLAPTKTKLCLQSTVRPSVLALLFVRGGTGNFCCPRCDGNCFTCSPRWDQVFASLAVRGGTGIVSLAVRGGTKSLL